MAKKKKVKKDDYPKSISKKAVTKAVEDGDLVKRDVVEENALKTVRGKLYNPEGNTELYKRIIALEQRINRIVFAIDKSRSVRGL